MMRRPRRSTLFPYATLFRSGLELQSLPTPDQTGSVAPPSSWSFAEPPPTAFPARQRPDAGPDQPPHIDEPPTLPRTGPAPTPERAPSVAVPAAVAFARPPPARLLLHRPRWLARPP